MTRLAWTSVLVLLLSACDDDGGGSAGAETSSSAGPDDSSTTANGSSSSTDPTTTGAASSSSSSSGDAGSSSGEAGSSSGGEGSSSSGDPNACDPQIPGEWNACVDENGNVDNTACNWMGLSGATGFIGCLTSTTTEGANVCMISGCEDACDCFAAPATGNAVVACEEVLDGGGRACVLQCGNGETCPDGMTCEGNLCFNPPA